MQATDTAPSPSWPALTDWLRLDLTPGLGCRRAHALLARYGSPGAVFAAAPALLAQHGGAAVARALAQRPAGLDAALDRLAAWLAAPGNQVLTPADPRYPPLLAHIPDPPLLLYVHGDPAWLLRPALAVVGSRAASLQGCAIARAFAGALAAAGIVVLSGLARGIDAAAHEGALAAGGGTAAVVGTGTDVVYPARHRALAARIVAQGCLVSELLPGTPPRSGHFPRRNRILSGLAAGVLVVEAAAASGSLITARVAVEQGREVFAVPGPVHHPLSRGCHQLIREGALLVESPADVAAALQGSPLLRMAGPAAAPAAPDDPLLAALGHGPLAPDLLGAALAVPASALAARLLELELAGLVERLPGGAVQRVVH